MHEERQDKIKADSCNKVVEWLLYLPCALIMADFPAPAASPLAPDLGLNIGAFFNMSGTMRNRIMLPRINTCSSCET